MVCGPGPNKLSHGCSVSLCYILKANFHLFWLTHTLVYLPTSRPFMCLPLTGLPSTLHCNRITMHNHTHLPTSLPFTRMQQRYNALRPLPTSLTGLHLVRATAL